MRHTVCAATILFIFSFGLSSKGQQTTNTNCSMYGNTANCTSTTTDYSSQQQQAYESGQQVGNAIGLGIAAAMRSHSHAKAIKNFCAGHPGWTIGHDTCLTDHDKSMIAVNKFMARHKDYIPEQSNSDLMMAYMESNKLDPREEKTYERTYKDLKKSGKLDLYHR